MLVFKSSSRMLLNEASVMNEAQRATAHSRLRLLFSSLTGWLREPLLHFLLIGLVLFTVYAYINRGRTGTQSPRQIVLSLDELQTMTAYFQSQWHRPPTPQEFQAMVEDKIKEEVLYREGLAMGLVLGGVAVTLLYGVVRRWPRTWAVGGATTMIALLVIAAVVFLIQLLTGRRTVI